MNSFSLDIASDGTGTMLQGHYITGGRVRTKCVQDGGRGRCSHGALRPYNLNR